MFLFFSERIHAGKGVYRSEIGHKQREGSVSRGLQQRKVGCDNPVTLDTAWKDTGLWLATTSERMLNAPVSHWHDWDLQLILLVQCLYRGDLPANVPCVPRAEAAESRTFPAPHKGRDSACCFPCCGSRRAAESPFSELCCNWNCKCPFLVFMGQKTRWMQLREGLTWYRGQENQHWKMLL